MRSILKKAASMPVIVAIVIALSAVAAVACHSTTSLAVNCDKVTGKQVVTGKALFPLDDPKQDWQQPGVVMNLLGDVSKYDTPDGITATRGQSITVISYYDGSSTETVNWAPQVEFVKPDGTVIQTVTASKSTITLPGECKAPIPTSVTGSVNTSDCNTVTGIANATVSFDVVGEPGTMVDASYSWTAEGNSPPEVPLADINGNSTYGVGHHDVDVHYPDWATAGQHLFLGVTFVTHGTNDLPVGAISFEADNNCVKDTPNQPQPPDEQQFPGLPPAQFDCHAPGVTLEQQKANNCPLPGDDTLPFTGDETTRDGLIGLALVVGGFFIVLKSRKKEDVDPEMVVS